VPTEPAAVLAADVVIDAIITAVAVLRDDPGGFATG
jgi:hypothetical protein